MKTIALLQVQHNLRRRRPGWVFTRARTVADGWTTSFPAFRHAYHTRVRHRDPAVQAALRVLGDQGIHLAALSVPGMEAYLSTATRIPRVRLVRRTPDPLLVDVPIKTGADSPLTMWHHPPGVVEALIWLGSYGVEACMPASQRRKPLAPRRLNRM